jgi:hypothetical protein
MTISGLKGATYNAFATYSTVDMTPLASGSISNGSATITLPLNSVVFLVTNSGTTTSTDNLNDFSQISAKSANWFIDTSNSADLLGDISRAARTVDDTEYIVYQYNQISNFNITLWSLAGSQGVTNSFKVFSSTNGGGTYQNVSYNIFSSGAGAGGWSYYNIAPNTALPGGTNALKFQLSSGTGNYWDPQIGSDLIVHQ